MGSRIDLSCDMGESFGRYTIGNDEAVMPHITTANLAAGLHGGDPHVMRESVQLAKAHDVHVGSHPGLPDLIGFGRRKMEITPQELKDYVVYQLGALRAFAERFDVPYTHCKPHGAMYLYYEDEEYTRAVVKAICEVDEDLIWLAPDVNSYEMVQEMDLPVRIALEGYVDQGYTPDGYLDIEKEKSERDPEMLADKFVRIVEDGVVEDVNGDPIDLPADTVCIHGDNPNVGAIFDAVYDRIEREAIRVTHLSDLV